MFVLDPEKITTRQARAAQAERVKKSIIYLINECIHKLKINDSKVLQMPAMLSKIELLSPEIHFYHHALQQAMRKQDVVEVRKCLSTFADFLWDYPRAVDYIAISSISNSEWENFAISEAKHLTLADCGVPAEIEPIFEPEISIGKDQVCAALCTIALHEGEMFDEIQQHVRHIKLFRGKVTMGLTDVRILGAMMIRLPRNVVNPVLYFIEHIIHEASHIHLNCLMAIDPLILNAPDERFTSPIRTDPRPMMGVFHATYVSARIARFFMKMYRLTGHEELLHTLAETLDETIRGTAEIIKNAKLTSAGQLLLTSINEFIHSAKLLSDWRSYDFTNKRRHRFGVGDTHVAALHRMVS